MEPLERFGEMPDVLGPYRLLGRLGRGGMSQVFRATRYGASGFAKQLALKTLPVEQLDNDKLTRALIEEARLCAALTHRNLVQVYDLGVDQGIYYLCMEVIDGINLKTLLAAERPSAAIALLIAAEIALALEYVHQVKDKEGRPLGLVHRDISPSNILLSRAGEVKLADFGIAKATLLADATWGRFRKGTIAYMSPEQVSGEALSSQSDQFSLGVVLYEMLCGSRPFDAETPVETLERIRDAQQPDLSGLSDPLKPLLQTMLQREPTKRFASSRDLFLQIDLLRRESFPATPFDLVDLLNALHDPPLPEKSDKPVTQATQSSNEPKDTNK